MPRHANTHCDPFSHGKAPAAFPAALIAAYRPLHAAGLLDRAAAQCLNVHPAAVCRLRNSLGLAPNLTKAKRREISRRSQATSRQRIDAMEARLEAIIADLNGRGLTDYVIYARLRETPDETSVHRITRIRSRLCLPSHALTKAACADRSRAAHIGRPVPPPPEPTDAAPGSIDKLQIMAARAADGYQIFHPLDNLGDA